MGDALLLTIVLLALALRIPLRSAELAAEEAARDADRAAEVAQSVVDRALAELEATLALPTSDQAPGPEGQALFGFPGPGQPRAGLSRPHEAALEALGLAPALLATALEAGPVALLGPVQIPGEARRLALARRVGHESDAPIAVALFPLEEAQAWLEATTGGLPLRLVLRGAEGETLAEAGDTRRGPAGAFASSVRALETAAATIEAWVAPEPGAFWRDVARREALTGLSVLLLIGTLALLIRRHLSGTRPALRLAAAVEALPEAFVLWDAEDRLAACNRKFRTLFPCLAPGGYRAGMTRAAAAACLSPSARGTGGRSPFLAETGPAGALRPLEDGRVVLASEVPLPGGGRVGLYRDVTGEMARVEALTMVRAVAEAEASGRARLLSHLSHKLRTPLTGLRQLADELGEAEGLAEAQRAQARMLAAAARHLLGLANGVLDLGALEAGGVVLQPEPASPAEVIAEAVAIATPIATAKGVAIRVRQEDLPARALLDPGRVRQVLLNLLGNAVKFAPEDSSVQLEAWREVDRLVVRVTDEGPGVPPDARDALFRDFTRIATGEGAGSGLGLAISARLVGLMGGEIGYEAPPAGTNGAAFRLALPLSPAPAAAAPPAGTTRPRAALLRPAARALRILAVDDSPGNLAVLRALLSTTGFLLETASDAPGALAAIAAAARENRSFDVVLMDLMMPGMDGLDATRRIRALPGPAGGVPVIAVTASAFPEDVAACRAAGMNGHVPKPVERMALLRAIARAVDPLGEAAAVEGDGLAALRPLFLAELAARLRALAAEDPPRIETVHALVGTIGHLGEADLLDQAREALRALRAAAADADGLVAALAAALRARFPALEEASAVAA